MRGREASAHAGAPWQWPQLAAVWRLASISTLGLLLAAVLAYTTSRNPLAAPPGIAVAFRAAMVLALIAGGLYARTSRFQTRMGGLLLGAGFFSFLWLLNGSGNRLLFSIGVLCSGLAPTVFSYLMLAYPSGHIRSRLERRWIYTAGGALMLLWVIALTLSASPPLRTPLVACASRCPQNSFSLGVTDTLGPAMSAALSLTLITLTYGTLALLVRRARAMSSLLRGSLDPILLVATCAAVALTLYRITELAGAHSPNPFGIAWVCLAAALPAAILVGLGRQRQSTGQALAELVSELARRPTVDPEGLMAEILDDPSLRVAYRRPGTNTYVDSAGVGVDVRVGDRAVTWIEGNSAAVAAVIFSPELEGTEQFVHAAAAAAVMRLEKAQLEANLRAATADLAASRARVIEAADAARRNLERDLHDSVQQDLVALRIKLEVAAELLKQNPEEAERALAAIGNQMDDVLAELRSLAQGIYPALLRTEGLAEALKSAVRRSPLAVSVRDLGIGRHAMDVEGALYFCCLEAVQNAIKHAGPEPDVIVTLWQRDSSVGFEVRDSGAGFDADAGSSGTGLNNMHDRIEAVGGALRVTSTPGRGTTVLATVPLSR